MVKNILPLKRQTETVNEEYCIIKSYLKTLFVKAKSGRLIADENEMLKRWVEHFNELLKSDVPIEE